MVDAIGKPQLKQHLEVLGFFGRNQKPIMNVFNEINKDKSFRDGKFNNKVLDGEEMQTFLEKTAPYLGDKAKNMRGILIQTGQYEEYVKNEDGFTQYNHYDNRGRIDHTELDYNDDGKPDRVEYNSYQEDKRVQTIAHRAGRTLQSNIWQNTINEYNSNGKLVKGSDVDVKNRPITPDDVGKAKPIVSIDYDPNTGKMLRTKYY